MFVAKVINNEVSEVGVLRHLYPDTSFPPAGPSEEWMQDNNCYYVMMFKEYDSMTQKLVPSNPYLEDGVVCGVVVEQKTQEEIDNQTASDAAKVRAVRNKLLAESDWTQVEDAPVDKGLWAAYRQELRDITNQPGFPYDVQYPSQPGANQ